MTRRRAVFLDRDGVINVNRPDHVKLWDEFAFLPNSLEGLRRLAASDFLVIVTTNQAAIARGLVREPTVRDIHTRMIAEVQRAGGRIDAIYYCPHLPEVKCACRKPQPGLYLQAADEFSIDLVRSWVVGDAVGDVVAALTIGAKPILVLTGRGQEQHACMVANNRSGYKVVDDLLAAANWIVHEEGIVL